MTVRSLRIGALLAMFALAGCLERTPQRDQMGVIKARFSTLQEALKTRNTTALDSLASNEMISDGMTIDSLYRFVSAGENNRAFGRFGK